LSPQLKGLGTYGFIKGATGFIMGTVGHSEKNLEDYGYVMERAILFATDIGLGTCWFGGTFTRSRFELTANELGLKGKWVIQEPKIEKPDRLTEYTVSWAG
jgi:nitroreductase